MSTGLGDVPGDDAMSSFKIRPECPNPTTERFHTTMIRRPQSAQTMEGGLFW